MQVIVSLYFLLIFLSALTLKKSKKIYLFLLILGFLIVAFQGPLGTDYYSYIRIYNGEKFFSPRKGILFIKMIEILNKMNFEYRSMFIVMGMIDLVLIYKIIKKMKKNNIIENELLYYIILVFSTNMYLQAFNGMRAVIATLFYMLSYLMVLEGGKIISIVTILIGSLFHPSILIIVPLLYLKKFLKIKYNIYVIIFYLTISIFLREYELFTKVAKYLYNEYPNFMYRHYLNSEFLMPYKNVPLKSLNIAIYVKYLFSLFSLRYYKKENNCNRILFFNIGYFSLGINFIFGESPMFLRLVTLLNFFLCYPFYNILKKREKMLSYILANICLFWHFLISMRGIFSFIEPS